MRPRLKCAGRSVLRLISTGDEYQSEHRQQAANGASGTSDAISSMTTKGMDSPGASHDFAAVRHTPRYDVFAPCLQWNSPSINDQRITALGNDHVFVVVVRMLR
jgi:hypothetical protein